ncbi:MAG: M28 family peptidase, partial [bacterium]
MTTLPRPTPSHSIAGLLRVLVTSATIVASPAALAQESTPSNPSDSSSAGSSSAGSKPTTPVTPDNAAPATERAQIHKAIGAAEPLVQAFNEHLTILASPWMEGRLPGTRGMERAMDYMEDQLILAGLEPGFQPSDGGPKTYRQPFSLGGKREVVEESIAGPEGSELTLVANKDFKLTSLGRSGTAESPIAFVGYGIEDGPDGYTSFAEDHSLEGKIALVLRFEPMNAEGKSRWSNGDGWSGRAGFAGKIGAVAKRKPAAIVVVNTPGADDPRIGSLSTAGGGRAMADIPVFMLSTEAGQKLVAACGEKRSLMDLRKLADEPPADAPRSFDLGTAAIKVAGRIEEKPVRAENIVGVLPGRGSLAKEVIVIGGHLDHLGNGDFGSREGPGKLHPGADDNASGSAGVILLGD